MSIAVLNDQQLVDAYVTGNENALRLLIERHKSKIFSTIYFMVNDRELAEDLFQDTFIKVIQTLKAGKYNDEGKFLPWVQRIAHNLVIDHFRREKKMKTVAPTDDFDIFKVLRLKDENIQDEMVRNQIEADVRKLVNFLPDDQREVVVMRMYQDLSFKEISEATGVSINTALGRMRYALINLRKLVDKHQMILND
ncbi:MAG TPA: sigma-70 family RNA polymerase sigma factor [Luteibaculaceae bacterium]|nr:sigma-70 family RNA polymerase sigma factor [Luteibaculaceae bacterium]